MREHRLAAASDDDGDGEYDDCAHAPFEPAATYWMTRPRPETAFEKLLHRSAIGTIVPGL
jgi:hypothetical protein